MVAFGAFFCIVDPLSYVGSLLACGLLYLLLVLYPCGIMPGYLLEVVDLRVVVLRWRVYGSCVVRDVSFAFGVLAFGLGSMLLALFLSLEMRFICLVSDFVMGGVVLCLYGFVVVVSLAISFGQGVGSNRWFLLPFSPLSLFGRWRYAPLL